MKAGYLAAAAAALLEGVNAHRVHRHAHELFHAKRGNDSEVCVPECTTIYTTITGSPICMRNFPRPAGARADMVSRGGRLTDM